MPTAWQYSSCFAGAIHRKDVILCPFDLLELDGRDLRRAPIEERKAALAKLLHQPRDGTPFNEQRLRRDHLQARLRARL